MARSNVKIILPQLAPRLEKKNTSPNMAPLPSEKNARSLQSEAQVHIFPATQDRPHSLDEKDLGYFNMTKYRFDASFQTEN